MPVAIVGWKGERVRLVPPDRTLHLENALRWMNDPEITATLEFNLGISRKQEEAFFDRIEGSSDSEFVWAILDETERHIGFIGLTAINWRNRSATGGLVIGERSCLGPGLCVRRGPRPDPIRLRAAWSSPDQRSYLQPGHEAGLPEVRIPARGNRPSDVLSRRAMARCGASMASSRATGLPENQPS